VSYIVFSSSSGALPLNRGEMSGKVSYDVITVNVPKDPVKE